MKVAVLLLAVFAVAYGNPAADSKEWRWVPRMPTVTPNPRAVPFQKVATPPAKVPRVPGSWRADNCGPVAAASPAVVNGQEATPHSYPWQVALFIDNSYFCGGSLISDEWVLTAAHCTTGSSSIEVVLGAHDLTVNEPTQVTIVSTGSDIITHADYGSVFLKNDVGLVHLSTPVTFTSAIQPVCLPGRSTPDLGAGVMLTASGWGVTSDSAFATVSDTLNEVTNPSISNSECTDTYGATITSATICTSTADGNKGTCSGDSGGPLNYVSGGQTFNRAVTSFVSSSGCMSGLPDGFTRTTHYLDWIETNTGIAIDP
jgi:secreted trypsin-like serine protease